MKERKLILILLLVVITVSLLIILRDISALNERSNVIVLNIEQLRQRITLLEQDRAVERIIALSTENVALKKEIEVLMTELNLISQRVSGHPGEIIQDSAEKIIKQETAPSGNKGFLKKEGIPAQ